MTEGGDRADSNATQRSMAPGARALAADCPGEIGAIKTKGRKVRHEDFAVRKHRQRAPGDLDRTGGKRASACKRWVAPLLGSYPQRP
jgi:hypothetical protein